MNIQAVLTLYPSNSTSCEGTESGDDISHTVPIYTGHALPHAILPLDCAGDYVIGGVMERLTDCGYHLTTTGERDLVTDVQEKLYSIALDIDTKQDAVHARRATQPVAWRRVARDREELGRQGEDGAPFHHRERGREKL